VAEKASANDILIVQSAGNSSDTFCVPQGTNQPLRFDAVTPCNVAFQGRTGPAANQVINADSTGPFSWASAHWSSASPNPIVVAESIDQAEFLTPLPGTNCG
jgi:hypothetical protein